MELSQIRYFIQTAQTQNMSKAAQVLNIAQPTLSKSIANLEKELGTQLFDRTGKKLVLNERGKRFLDGALASMQELDSAAAAAKDHLIGSTLHLGLFHISDKFMRCLSDFSSSNPDIIFKIDHLIDDSIDTNEFDMLLYPRNAQFKRYKGDILYTDTYCLAVNNGNPLADRSEIELSDILCHKLIALRYNESGFDPPRYMLQGMGIANDNVIYTNSGEIQRQMISNGCGVGFVPTGSSESYKRDGNMILLPVLDMGLSLEIMIGFKREKHLSESGKSFSDFVLNYFEIIR